MIKTSFEIYNRYLIKILILSLVVVIPFSLFVYFLSYYLYDYLDTDQYPNLYMIYFLILNFISIVPLYRKLMINDLNDEEELTVWALAKEFFEHFGVVLLISLPLFLIAILGIVLAFIPTIISAIFILVFPFFVHDIKFKHIFIKTSLILKQENITIIFDLLVVVSIQVLIYSLLMQMFVNFDSNIYVYGGIRAIVNAIIFPLLIFYLTQRYTLED